MHTVQLSNCPTVQLSIYFSHPHAEEVVVANFIRRETGRYGHSAEQLPGGVEHMGDDGIGCQRTAVRHPEIAVGVHLQRLERGQLVGLWHFFPA